MADVIFSPRAYCKIILHAAKYPHCAINGLLLARLKNKNDGKSPELRIEDAIPLFHICLHVSPMAEIALTLVDQLATSKGLILAGYYLANENINDLSTDRPAHRIADKIAENCSGAVLVVVDNKEMTLNMTSSPLRISQYVDGKWKLKDKSNIFYEGGVAPTDALYSLLEGEQYRNLVDFDNHLDNITLDWQNHKLNKVIDETVEEHE
ncbi:ER membrane protein complex subunit 8-like [Vespa mandarinia]|uniref:ER membrane protein complex subunit 8-like n=1 Tax=Vespa mandarinia TaxID=7446 RepID=UPI00160E21D3|nr:ER membrane protein complex subunit 8-like [Vespa mandarinia]XP_047359663.1 ER membrane protein complex subunit 8 [Vespa velutina]